MLARLLLRDRKEEIEAEEDTGEGGWSMIEAVGVMGRWVGRWVVEGVCRLRTEADRGWLLGSSSETKGDSGMPVVREEPVDLMGRRLLLLAGAPLEA